MIVRRTGGVAQLDVLVNDRGIDQLTASQMLWAPHLVTPATPPPPDPGPAGPLEEQLAWARYRGRQIVRDGLADVLRWLGERP